MNGLLDNIGDIVINAMEQAAPGRWDEYIFDYSQPITEEPSIAWINGVGILFKEGPTIISGPKKAGKTTFVRLLLAAILSGENVLGITAKSGLTVTIFDTEQQEYRILSYIDKSFQMACLARRIDPRLNVYRLRKSPVEKRLQIIVETIEEKHPDIAIVDGVADLVLDINSMETATKVMDELLRVSDETGTALILIIHTNPSTPDGKSRGNLGTIAENKAECNILVSKSGDIFTVSCKDARGRPFPSFSYAKTENNDIVQASAPAKPITAKDRILAYMEPDQVYKYAELLRTFVDDKTKEGTVKTAIRELCAEGYIVAVERGRYRLKNDEG